MGANRGAGSVQRRSRLGVGFTCLALLAGCGTTSTSGSSGPVTINWYVNPNTSGSYQKIVDSCVQQSAGRYKVALQVLPATADGQREQVVRRLAAGDASMDVVTVDPPYTAELANAGWLRPFSQTQRTELLQNVLAAPIATAVWQGTLVAAPWIANTQLLWYRKSVAQKAGVDPTSPTFTWDKLIDAAVKTGTKVEEQGGRYEGYAVWVNAMVLGAGGQVLENNDRGKDATVALDSPAGLRAAQIIKRLATSKAADPSLATATEEIGRAAFEGPSGGFMLNWPYVYAAFQADVKAGTLKPAWMDDLGWARYPRVDADRPSKPPIGGNNLVISKFSKHPTEDYALVKCIVSPAMEKIELLLNGDPEANALVYKDPEVVKSIPMAALIQESIDAAGPRAITPFYGDVSGALQRTWQPPASINPTSTPKNSAKLIHDVLEGRRLL
ncbi:MAG: trehalose/maltose transport system substrate-binding protein [Frankiales bacterium]|jgi:multiple sugar transport system substrate-binding protein|nr:trehalose/maltose transport system substrate-binding protein [Frankiales bacterium]